MDSNRKVTHLGRRVALIGATVAMVTGVLVVGGTALASSRHTVKPAAVPKVDIVGKGIFNCATVTGEVGYSPAIKANSRLKERVSIWFLATNCKPAAGAGAQPIPKFIVGALSFPDNNFLNGCPQLSGPPLGVGTLDLAYNFPGVPALMIDPSVAPLETVKQLGAFWTISGLPGITDGSYVSPTFTATIKPNPIGGQNCKTGITSEYISRGTLKNV
jgi:hypothetical protein